MSFKVVEWITDQVSTGSNDELGSTNVKQSGLAVVVAKGTTRPWIGTESSSELLRAMSAQTLPIQLEGSPIG